MCWGFYYRGEPLLQRGEKVPTAWDGLQAVKAKRREEVGAVCAVRLHHRLSGGQYYLLVKRPENGLLAGVASHTQSTWLVLREVQVFS